MTCRIRVCRDCCCGTSRKHPEVDHDGLLARLTRNTTGSAQVSVTGCLLACELSNVVVVSPGPLGRRLGARPVWLKQVLADEVVDLVAEWVGLGGPGVAPMPAALVLHETPAPALAEATGPSEELLG